MYDMKTPSSKKNTTQKIPKIENLIIFYYLKNT